MFYNNDFYNNIEENENEIQYFNLNDNSFNINGSQNINNDLFYNNENYHNENIFDKFNFTIFPEEQHTSINEEANIIQTAEKNKLLGRKRKDEEVKGKHTKYYFDNKVRKVKVLFKDALLKFINSKIKNLNLIVRINGKIYMVEKLLKINPKLTEDINIESNKTLFNTEIKNILSENISRSYRRYPQKYNKVVIEEILKNKNNQVLIDILNMKYLDCLKYYRKDKEIINDDKYSCLKGLEKEYENLSGKLQKDANGYDKVYEDGIFELIKNFETIYSTKTPRSGKNKTKNL